MVGGSGRGDYIDRDANGFGSVACDLWFVLAAPIGQPHRQNTRPETATFARRAPFAGQIDVPFNYSPIDNDVSRINNVTLLF